MQWSTQSSHQFLVLKGHKSGEDIIVQIEHIQALTPRMIDQDSGRGCTLESDPPPIRGTEILLAGRHIVVTNSIEELIEALGAKP
jgi:hypothetical protein